MFHLAFSTSNYKSSNTKTTCLRLSCKLSQHSYDYITYGMNYIMSYIVFFIVPS